MIIVNLVGGLGNQMFQYAFMRDLEHVGKNVILHRDYTDETIKNLKYNEIFDVFGIERKYVSHDEAVRFLGYNRPIKKLLYQHFHITSKRHIQEKDRGKYSREYYKYDDGYFDGYWQSYKYFSDIQLDIQRVFTPVLKPNKKCQDMIEKIQKDDSSVAVHMRLGDYTTEVNRKIYGDICTPAYYKAAFEYMQSHIVSPVFYVFSNDLSAAKSFFNDEKVVFVDCNDISEAWADMHLMSLCKNNIIANSSFSWWGAYLNKNKDKIVVAPAKWKNTDEMPDICPSDWIRI
ncbi:alpha-1,2-fucosyltransferase [Butyrivibrio sp. YAB3001]|uniref:alpha-1,2-fucosyltransferase n=1 Tax=Butyrivibrio sp. YAB3001 TaxID=1520812 RepID=UPI0008F65820|nr:alpha-1,2-fucosyltransferase [Butyrivibrio sp. YAB3001]SFC74723.1 Glycosyl transferase family 11 [Butyrivibrio sp. YAB3001]